MFCLPKSLVSFPATTRRFTSWVLNWLAGNLLEILLERLF